MLPLARPSHSVGPRRSDSLKAYRWGSRAFALAAVLALTSGIVSDAIGGRFWERHGLIAGIVGSFLVVIVSIAVLNGAIERRRQARWRVLAQYVMVQLVLNARVMWTGIAELAGTMSSGARTASALDIGARTVRDTSTLTDAVQELLADAERRGKLHEELASVVSASEAVFERWAGVMLNANVYAELIDRHVELANHVFWLDSLLHSGDSADEDSNQRRRGHLLHSSVSDDQDSTQRRASQSHPAVQFEGNAGDDLLASRIVFITQLAEELDRRTIGVAQGIVSIRWWTERLGMRPPVWTGETSSAEPIVP